MPRFFEKITVQELAKKIFEAGRQHPFYELDEEAEKEINGNYIEFVEQNPRRVEITRITPQVDKDLREVDFDYENIEAEAKEMWNVTQPIGTQPIGGFKTLDNGLSYLGVISHGDWESPVFFIIYWDGDKLRGYVPTDGNPWNKITHKAYGNDFKTDEEDYKKQYPTNGSIEDFAEISADPIKIIADIKNRIQPKVT